MAHKVPEPVLVADTRSPKEIDEYGPLPTVQSEAAGRVVARRAARLADPDALSCIGSNHVPGCDHLAAPAAPPFLGLGLAEIPLELIDIGSNVRVTVQEVAELADSIREHGVLQPVKVVPVDGGRYRLVWGQRRVMAAREAGLSHIPAIIEAGGDALGDAGAKRSIEQLVENLHRADLNPIDRATAMRAVVDSGVSQADLARTLGIAPSTVSNDLRILTLTDPVLERIRAGEISASHGKAMASLPPAQQSKLAESIVGRSLSSKDLELLLEWRRQEATNDEAKAARTTKILPKAIAALEAAAVPKDATVYASGDYYSMDVDGLRRDLVSAGWTGVDSKALAPRPEQVKCDCTAAWIDLGGRSPKVTPACTDSRHGDRQRNIDHGLKEEARAAFEARKVAVQHEIERQLRAAGLHPVVLELIEKAIGTFYGAPARPDRDIVAAIALAIVGTWKVREAITPELVAELGLEASA